MKSASLYVFIALGALLVSHASAAPISALAQLGKEFIKFLVSSTNEQAEAEAAREAAREAEIEKSNLSMIGKQVDALIQVAFDGMNEVLAAAQEYLDNQQGNRDTFEDSFRK